MRSGLSNHPVLSYSDFAVEELQFLKSETIENRTAKKKTINRGHFAFANKIIVSFK